MATLTNLKIKKYLKNHSVTLANSLSSFAVTTESVILDNLRTWADTEGEGGGRQGVRTPSPGIAILLIFVMLKYSVRPLLGIWTTTPEKIFWIRA